MLSAHGYISNYLNNRVGLYVELEKLLCSFARLWWSGSMRNCFIAPLAMQSPSCPKSGNPKISGSYTQGVHPYTTNFVLCRKCSSPLSVTQHRYCCVGISSRPRQFILVAILWYIQNQKCRINGPVRHSFNLSTVYHLKTESCLCFVNFRSLLENCTEHTYILWEYADLLYVTACGT